MQSQDNIQTEKPVLFDMKLKKIGCVLLQAAVGGDTWLPSMIDNQHWLLSPTPDLRLYSMTREQKIKLVEHFKV